MRLSDRTVLVTGGSGGIGFGIAEAFHSAGSTVIICGRDEGRLSEAREKLSGITALRCDVSNRAERERLAKEVLGEFPGIDVLVNTAGIQRYNDLTRGYEELRGGGDEIAVNLVAMVELTALFIGHLLKRPSAAVVNVGSGLGFMPMVHTPVYSATKAAVHTYSLVLRKQLEGTNVKVVEIVPPMVDTGLNREGRDAAGLKYRGVGLAEYIPSVVEGLENDDETIFFGDGASVMTGPRGESERRLLDR